MKSMAGVADMAGSADFCESRRMASTNGAQLPLAMVNEGDQVTVSRVRGAADLRQHMAELGFVPGATVKVVSHVDGDVLVSVKGASFGLSRQMSMKIITC